MWGAIASIGASIGSTLLGNHSAKKEAQRNRDWQEEMSNTSIQRRMADLKAAGLNPLLAVESAGSGASTPSGSQANVEKVDIGQVLNAYMTFKQSKVADAEARRINADAQRIEDDNTLFKYKEAEKVMDMQLKSLNISSEKMRQELMRIESYNGKINYVINTLKAKGIEIDNEQAKITLAFMQRDLGLIENGTTAKNYEYITGQVGRFTNWIRSIADMIPGIDISETSTVNYKGGSHSTTTHSRRYW